MQNIFLFTWEENYLLDKELLRRKQWFISKYWDKTLYEFNYNNFDIDKIINSLHWWWLFSEKKMVIIKWIPIDNFSWIKFSTNKTENFIKNINFEKISKDIILIFVSYKPDKRLKSYKTILKYSELKEFKKFKQTTQYINFIIEYLENKIWKDLANYIYIKIWKDLYRLTNELDKIKYMSKKSDFVFNKKNIDDILRWNTEENSFLLFDYMLEDKNKTLEIIKKIKWQWTDFNQMLWMLYRWLKNFILILDLYELWDSWKEIASKAKIHPFVVNKTLKYIKLLQDKKNEIKNLYKNILYLDFSIKSWRLDSIAFWLKIKQYLLDFYKNENI